MKCLLGSSFEGNTLDDFGTTITGFKLNVIRLLDLFVRHPVIVIRLLLTCLRGNEVDKASVFFLNVLVDRVEVSKFAFTRRIPKHFL